MKTLYPLLTCLLLLAAIPFTASAQTPSSKGFGLALKASTNGLGADAVLSFHKNLIVRLGYEKLGINRDFNFSENDVNYGANVDFTTGSASVLLDFYPVRYFFLTAGLGWNLFHAEVDGQATGSLQWGDIQIPAEQIGHFNFQVDPSLHLSPYAGIGIGRTLGLNRRVGFAFELGGFYQGSPDITITSDGMLSPSSNPDQGHEARLERQISQYSIYPVARISLSFKLFKF